jgi:hypothetical protein
MEHPSYTRHDWPLVYVISIKKGPHYLAIRIGSTKMGKDLFRSFFPDAQSGIVDADTKSTNPTVVQELGWFEDIDMFAQICQDEPVPVGGQQDLVFDMWTSNVLQTIKANHEALWIPNEG